MQNTQKSMKTMTEHGFSQFKFTQNLLNNLSQFEITPAAKLVLLYLSSCYNPQKADIFPKQKTIAQKIGVSERSVVRAICELIKAGLIIAECKNTNRYKFTSKIAQKLRIREKIFTPDNLSENEGQNDGLKGDNLSPHEHEPMNEPNNEPTQVGDYKILKQYALEHGARNVNAYIKWMQKEGVAQKVLKEYKQVSKRYQTNALKHIETIRNEQVEQVPPEYFANIRKKLVSNLS